MTWEREKILIKLQEWKIGEEKSLFNDIRIEPVIHKTKEKKNRDENHILHIW
jgi:hypothetical protein